MDPEEMKKRILSLEEEKELLKKQLAETSNKKEVEAMLKTVNDSISELRAALAIKKTEPSKVAAETSAGGYFS